MRSKLFRWLQVANSSFQGLFSQGLYHCPCQEHRCEQAYDGEQTRVPWTLAGRLFIRVVRVHDRHSLSIFLMTFRSCIDPRQYHVNKSCYLARRVQASVDGGEFR